MAETGRRVELHLHTKYSPDDSVTEVGAYLEKAASDRQRAMAVTDFLSVGAFQDALLKKTEGFRVLFGLEFPIREGGREFHATALAKNADGLLALHALASGKAVEKSELATIRGGLLIGSACDEGELYQALLSGQTEGTLEKTASFYDYIEVQPPDNFAFLIEQGKIISHEAIVNNIKKLVRLGSFMDIPVAAVGDVCFLDKKDIKKREVLLGQKGVTGEYAKAPLYFRKTEEMMNEFPFLDADAVKRIVVANTNKIAGLCMAAADLMP